MSALQFFWFFLIGLLFSGFFFLEGFDFGVGMAVQTLTHNEHEKDQVVETIGQFGMVMKFGFLPVVEQCLLLFHTGMLHYLVVTI